MHIHAVVSETLVFSPVSNARCATITLRSIDPRKCSRSEDKMKLITAAAFLLGLVACTHSQENIPSADEVLQQFGGVIDVPELNNLNAPALPSIEEAKNLFKEKCKKNGGADAFNNAMRARVDMVHCLQSLINIMELQAEIEKYKPTGDLGIVFKNYCNKRPILRACFNNFTNTVEHCLDEKERENNNIIWNIADSLLEFICYKEGDRIALFISTNGPECFQSKDQAIRDCANNIYGGYIPKTDPSNHLTESWPLLTFGTRECSDMANLQVCVVAELKKCPDSTPANIMDSIFNFVKRVTTCENVLNAQSAAATGTKSAFGASHVSGALSILAIISLHTSFFTTTHSLTLCYIALFYYYAGCILLLYSFNYTN